MRRILLGVAVGLLFTGGVFVCAATSVPTPTPAGDADLERMRLENERMKLENERLKLEIEMKEVETGAGKSREEVIESPKDKKERARHALAEMSAKSSKLAEEWKGDPRRVVLDLVNGELWFRGVRHSLNDIQEFYDREGWQTDRKVVKRFGNGYARYRYPYRNIFLDRYEHKKRGVFTWVAPAGSEGFIFITPEGLMSESSYDEFRNGFDNDYFEYEKQKKKGDHRILRYKHKTGFIDFNDKLEFWFDKDDRLAKLRWGVLDEH